MARVDKILKGIDYLKSKGLPVPMIWNDKQQLIRDSKDPYLLCYGGRDSAKSHGAAQKFVVEMEQKEYYWKGVMVRKHFNSIRDSQFETIKQIIYDTGKQNDFIIRNNVYEFEHRSTGLKTIAKGLDKPDKMKSMKDPTCIWWEEPNTDGVTFEDFVKTDTSLRGARANYFQNIFTFNSDDGENWLKDYFFPEGLEFEKHLPEKYLIESPDSDAKIIHFTYHDNFFISQGSIDKLEKLKEKSIEYYNIFGLGLWGGGVKGLIIEDFKVITDEEYNAIKPYSNVSYGVDWGYNDPMTLIEVLYYDQKIYLKELYYQSFKLAEDLRDFMLKEGVSKYAYIYPDPSRPDSISILRKAGFNCQKVDNSILDGINSLKEHCLNITESSTNILRERRFYKWKETKEGKSVDEPLDFENHTWDSIRYAIHNNPVIKNRPDRYY